MKLNKNLIIFLMSHLFIWSALPLLLRPNLPMDSAEALIWGFIGEWGTNKHPPLSGVFADLMYQLSGEKASSLYILSQLFVVGGLAYIYKLGRLFLPDYKALLAMAVLEGVAYYNLVTPEYNVNIIALFLWPAAVYHFYLAVTQDRLRDWLLFGLFAGLNLLNKYVSGVLLACLGAYLLLSKQGRKSLCSWKLYLAGLVGLGIVGPHLYWLHRHDYFVIDYFLGRSNEGQELPFGLAHLVYPFKFLVSQLLTASAALLVLSVGRHYSPQETIAVTKQNRQFIFFAGILPVLVMATISFILGIKLKSMWGSPVLYMLGICFFVWRPFGVQKNFRSLLGVCYGLMFLFAFAFTAQCLLTKSAKFNLDAADFTSTVAQTQPAYVGGSVWLASTVGAYLKPHPEVLFLMSPPTNPWIDMAKVKKQGILVVEENLSNYSNYQKSFANLPEPEVYLLKVKNILGQTKEYRLYYGKIAGESE